MRCSTHRSARPLYRWRRASANKSSVEDYSGLVVGSMARDDMHRLRAWPGIPFQGLCHSKRGWLLARKCTNAFAAVHRSCGLAPFFDFSTSGHTIQYATGARHRSARRVFAFSWTIRRRVGSWVCFRWLRLLHVGHTMTPNPAFEPTRNGWSLQAPISFWAFRAQPPLAAQLER